MFTRLSTFTALGLSLLATATPTPHDGGGGEPVGNCNTGDLQCCQSTETAGSASGAALLGLLGIVGQDLNTMLGVTCSPITVIGGGGTSGCSAEPVCCKNNSYGGQVSIGCVPVQL